MRAKIQTVLEISKRRSSQLRKFHMLLCCNKNDRIQALPKDNIRKRLEKVRGVKSIKRKYKSHHNIGNNIWGPECIPEKSCRIPIVNSLPFEAGSDSNASKHQGGVRVDPPQVPI